MDRGQSSEVQASRLAPRGRRTALLGLVARSGSKRVEGWGRMLGVLRLRLRVGYLLLKAVESDFFLGMSQDQKSGVTFARPQRYAYGLL